MNVLDTLNYRKVTIYFCIAVGAVLLAVSTFHKVGGFGVETDFYWSYAPDAENILHGRNTQEPGVGPVYPLVLGVANLLFDDYFVSGKVISILSAVFAGFFIFKLLASLFDERIGFFTMVLFHAVVAPFSIVASTDLFFAFLFTVSLYVFYRGNTISRSNLMLGGLLMGLAFLTRYNAVVLPICVMLTLLVVNPEGWSWSERVKNLALFLTVFVLINIPWNVVQFFSSGEPVRSDSYLIIASHFYGKPGVVASEDMHRAAQQFGSLADVIFYDLPYFVKHYIKNIYRHFYDFLLHSIKFPAFLFGVAGAVMLLPRMSKKQLSLFIYPILSFLLLCLVHYEPRYYLYLTFFFILCVVYFLFGEHHFMSGASGANNVTSAIPVALFIATMLFLTVFSAKEIRKTIREEPRELLEIAETLRDVSDGNQAIIARKPHIGFLTGLRTVYFPQVDSIEALVAFARRENADFLIYGTEELKRRPVLSKLLDPDKLPENMEPIIIWENPKTVVYRFSFGETLNSG